MATPAHLPDDLGRPLRAVRALLLVIACLLGLMVLGLGVGSWVALRYLGALEERAIAQAGVWRDLTRDLGQEATRRQTDFSTGLTGQSRATEQGLRALEARRKNLGAHPPNPLAKLDQVIDLTAFIGDELLLLLRHAVETQNGVGESMKPLPTQKKLTKPGSAP